MIEEFFLKEKRSVKTVNLDFDFVVAGGGMAGVCAAIAAARFGIRVALIQDRPVLGGNASSEVRLWVLGATSHMGNNNRWAREGGILNEILVENTYKNKEGNPIVFDTLLLDKVLLESNISLFLNTVIIDVEKSDIHSISSVSAYNPQNETKYKFSAPYFCDSTGDGLLAYLGGARFRIGAEDTGEFSEKFAPDKITYGEKLGHTMFFYTKDVGYPVEYIAPEFALKIEDVERYINRLQSADYFMPHQSGCKYWWIEYGGRLDTITDTEEIKYKLLEVLYGIWNYIKNSGKYSEVENMTLEWVGCIPGKRESRRFVGYYMLNQKDIIEQRKQPDTVAFGGWSLDLHPADGVFSTGKKACNQWHTKGIYPIPYRCYITPDLDNVFLAGRIISASHVAFASTRVMATSAAGGEVVGTAAAYCLRYKCKPQGIMEAAKMKDIQTILTKKAVYLPQTDVVYSDKILEEAEIKVSSELQLGEIPFDGAWRSLSHANAQILPLNEGRLPVITVRVKVSDQTQQQVELRISSKPFNYTPDVILETQYFDLSPGEHKLTIRFNARIPYACYAFICFSKNDKTALLTSKMLVTGILSVFNKILPAISNFGKQENSEDLGIEEFEFWCPERRPQGQNIAMTIEPAISCFSKENLLQTPYRPTNQPNAWVSNLNDEDPTIKISWNESKKIRSVRLFADTDYDHAMETVQWGHHDRKMPFCVDTIELRSKNLVLKKEKGNFKTEVQLVLDEEILVDELEIHLKNSNDNVPVALFGIQIN